ncbi:2-hydroxyglutaryl-CoA dehydratase D-component [Rhodomicrobium vannielii ATCC 17100]|uniref:2-hydroxyglutaryl-CoA dehydratase D-component n=1 Tax=Rhodomicrobium vannielii (strain ATCC 17100 / DSM 162 / LMG 4299 / NCIMB 10020 / ATH 3.1.1) TaxID=648757 RepID=E3I4W1_RHOVT|nr:2-hydroxyacyl-CoA dehydratase family protein [Rhodomicrobium vannielii]ADP72783.1 2-hydroxyglutaryl-CoA dehydratase D-component [Rhodomicrobium vannielii ATCC 17100]
MSIKTIEQIRKRLAERPAEIAEARRGGAKVVGWFNYNVPEEVIDALGLIPVRLGTGGSDRLVELGSRYISTGNCVYVRQAAGLFAEAEDPYIVNSDLVVFDVTCKQVYRLAEIVSHYFNVNTLVLGVPYNFTVPAGVTYFRKETAALTRRLEEHFGVTLTADNLRASVRLYEEIRAAIRKLYEYQKQRKSPISWSESNEVVQAGNFLDRREYLSLLEQLLQELKNSSRDAYRHLGEDAPRLLLTGSIIPPGDSKLPGVIEELGGRIVVDDLWSGFAPARLIHVRGDTLDDVADGYLVPHASLPNLDFEGDTRLSNLKALSAEFDVSGVLFHSLRYCDAFTFKAPETKRFFLGLGISFLEIHTEYAGSDYEAIRTRVEAFLELVKGRSAALV